MTKDPIKAKIQELCPDISEVRTRISMSPLGTKEEKNYVYLKYPITLAVVLRAIGIEKCGELVDVKLFDTEICNITLPNWDIDFKWNLSKDNYDDQSEETKQFIGKILGITN